MVLSRTKKDNNKHEDTTTPILDDSNTSNLPAETDPAAYEIIKMPKGEALDMIRANLGGEQITAADLNRVTVPTGGGTIWTVPTIAGDDSIKAIDGIMIHAQPVRAYWLESFDDSGGGSPPDCVSRDGLTGFGDPGGDCMICPLSKWETAKGGQGRGKACSESKLIYIIAKDEILPMVIKIPPTSLGNARKYLMGLTSKRQRLYEVYTRLTLEGDKNADGIKFSKVVFQKTGDVEKPELLKSYADLIKPLLTASAESIASEQDPSD